MRSAILLCCLLVEAPDRRRLAAYNYMHVAKLTAADAAAEDNFGRSVAIDGDTIVIGAYRKSSYTGAAYVFRTSDGGATYGQVAKLTASDASSSDYFGCSVAIDGDTVVVGAYWESSGRGAVYVFLTTGGATYGEVAKLTATDSSPFHYFGWSVAIAGDTVFVGARYDDDAAFNSGAVYVFRTSDGGATYDEVAKLTASDAAAGDNFGYSVAIAGDTVVVGFGAYVFRTSDGGATYDEVAKLTAADASSSDYFGVSVAIDGNTVVVGASGGEAAYVFRTDDGGATYDEVAKLTAADASSSDYFGVSVAIDGHTVVVGTWGGEAAYVFRTSDGGATYGQVAKLTASDGAAGDRFGWSVAIDDDRVMVGAYEDNDAGTNSGSAYVLDANAPTSQPTTSEPTSQPTTSEPTSQPTTSQPTTSQPTTGHPTPRPSPRPTPRPSPQPTPAQPTLLPTPLPTAQPTAQPTKQVDDVLAPWEIALISIASVSFCVACFVFLRPSATGWTRTKAHGAAATAARISPAAPPAAETPPMLRTTSVLPMGTVEAVHAPDDAPSTPPILGEVVTHSTVLSVSN